MTETECLSNNGLLVPLTAGADLVLCLSFLTIAVAIAIYLRKKQPEFHGLGWMVVGCVAWFGLLHLANFMSFLYPIHPVIAGMKAITALVVFIFAIALFPLLPTIIQVLTPRQYDQLLEEVYAQNNGLKKQLKETSSINKHLEDQLTGRVRNMLAIIHGLSKETARSAGDIGTYLHRFNARLSCLTHANDLLLTNDWQGAPLLEVIHSQLEVVGLKQVQLSGPNITLNPHAVQTISMAIHELSANSVAYGDHVAQPIITWYYHQDSKNPFNDSLRLLWTEAVTGLQPPKTKGFGMAVLNYLTPTALDGLSDLRFDDRGVVWELEVPMHNIIGGTRDNLRRVENTSPLRS